MTLSSVPAHVLINCDSHAEQVEKAPSLLNPNEKEPIFKELGA